MMKRTPDFSLFLAVVKAGTLSEASRVLGMSAAVLSKYLTQLEQHMKLRLLARSARGFHLTEHGRELFESLDHMLPELTPILGEPMSRLDHPTGTLKVVSSIALGRHRVAPLLSEFSARYPEVSIQLQLGDAPEDLFRSGVDVVISPGEPIDQSLVARRLITHPCCLCAAPDYLARRPAPRHPRELHQHDCLILDCHGAFRDRWVLRDPRGGNHTIKVAPHKITDNSEQLKEWLLGGHGLALKSEWDIAEHLRRGELVKVLPDYEMPQLSFYVIYGGRQLVPAKTRAFVQFIENQLRPREDPERLRA
ncbi:LysR family transcriptional regulator [Alloalcanivorax xenomutans]|uniref:LysR family transcriptional regulator n=1 Tax=Alloalcanivorax xenomutans TaxID=1094342 RepID=UPI003A7F71F7